MVEPLITRQCWNLLNNMRKEELALGFVIIVREKVTLDLSATNYTVIRVNSITNGLINETILKKIVQICGSKKEKLTLEDFCYFFALLNTTSFEPKLNFLLDFINN